MIDFTQLGLNSLQKQINPRDIFMGLSNKSKKYQYPRDVQGEVWKQWFEQRNERDTIIKNEYRQWKNSCCINDSAKLLKRKYWSGNVCCSR